MADKAKRSGHERHALDFYKEPGWAVDVLLDAETFPEPIYDPAAGSGTIVDRCTQRQYNATGTDLADHGYGIPAGFEFQSLANTDARSIICNPPYQQAVEFCGHARTLAEKVAMLVRLDFLASQRRREMIESLTTVIVLSKRPSMPPGDSDSIARGGQHDFAWIIWDRDHRGPPQLLARAP